MEDEIKGAILCNNLKHRDPPADNCASKYAIENDVCETPVGEYPFCPECFPNEVDN